MKMRLDTGSEKSFHFILSDYDMISRGVEELTKFRWLIREEGWTGLDAVPSHNHNHNINVVHRD